VLREIQGNPEADRVRLFQPGTVVRTAGRGGLGNGGRPNGAAIRYYLPEGFSGEVTLAILDGRGQLVRQFSSQPASLPTSADPFQPQSTPAAVLNARAGGNVFVWDLKYPGVRKTPGAVFRFGDPGGPLAVPGDYQLRLTAGGETQTSTLKIVKDPRLQTSPSDFEEQFRLAMQIRDKANETFAAVAEIRNIRSQLSGAKNRVSASAKAVQVVQACDSLDRKLWLIEDALIQFRVEAKNPAAEDYINWPDRIDDKLVSLLNWLEAADAQPTDADYTVFKMLSNQLAAQSAKLKTLIETDLLALNQLLRQAGSPPIELKYTDQNGG
jgi:hypothetical protein